MQLGQSDSQALKFTGIHFTFLKFCVVSGRISVILLKQLSDTKSFYKLFA